MEINLKSKYAIKWKLVWLFAVWKWKKKLASVKIAIETRGHNFTYI